MELEIIRTYHEEGVNGSLYVNGVLQCYTIELPWKNNEPRRSCIPEGRYMIQKRYSPKFKHHLHLLQVPGRSLILMHSANDAKKELFGCIAPVSIVTDPGKGLVSKVAFEWIKTLVYPALEKGPVFVNIKSIKNDIAGKSKVAHAEVL